MSRVRLIRAAEAPLLARPFVGDAEPDPLIAALSQVPELLESAMPFVATAFAPSAIPLRTKEIVILRSSVLLGCQFCTRAHSLGALDNGLTRSQVVALRNVHAAERRHAEFPDAADRALIDWVDALVGETGPIADAVAAGVQSHFVEHEFVELTLLAGVTMMLARFCTALELPTSPETLARIVAEGLE